MVKRKTNKQMKNSPTGEKHLYSIEWSDNNTSHFSWRAWCLLEDCWLSGEICLEPGLGCPSRRCRLQGHRLIELHLLTTLRTTKDVTAQGWMFGLPHFSCNILCCCEQVGNKWLEWLYPAASREGVQGHWARKSPCLPPAAPWCVPQAERPEATAEGSWARDPLGGAVPGPGLAEAQGAPQLQPRSALGWVCRHFSPRRTPEQGWTSSAIAPVTCPRELEPGAHPLRWPWLVPGLQAGHVGGTESDGHDTSRCRHLAWEGRSRPRGDCGCLPVRAAPAAQEPPDCPAGASFCVSSPWGLRSTQPASS